MYVCAFHIVNAKTILNFLKYTNGYDPLNKYMYTCILVCMHVAMFGCLFL